MKMQAFFIKMKYMYRDSTIHSYTYTDIAEMSGVCVTTVKKYLKLLMRWQWVEKRGVDLFFKKFPMKFNGRTDCRLSIDEHDTVTTISRKLRLLPLKVLSESKDAEKYNLGKHVKRFAVPNRVIGETFDRSRSTASRLMKWANDTGLCRVRENIPFFTTKYSEFEETLNKTHFPQGRAIACHAQSRFHFMMFGPDKGKFFVQTANIITFLK